MKQVQTRPIKLLLAAILLTQLASGMFFDTIVSYRHGSNSLNVDTSHGLNEEEPDAPASVDQVYGYTSSNPKDGTIDLVHCYSMRNGLYGKSKEARVIWTQLGFENLDYYLNGSAKTVKVIKFPIET